MKQGKLGWLSLATSQGESPGGYPPLGLGGQVNGVELPLIVVWGVCILWPPSSRRGLVALGARDRREGWGGMGSGGGEKKGIKGGDGNRDRHGKWGGLTGWVGVGSLPSK